MANRLDLADAQFIGYIHAKAGDGIISLVKGMGLTKKEWEKWKENYLAILSEEAIQDIDEYFQKQIPKNLICKAYELKDLQGAIKKLMPCFILSIPDNLKFISRDIAGTCAGKKGALNIWIDIKGKYHCEYYVNCITRDLLISIDKEAVKEWFITNIKKIK